MFFMECRHSDQELAMERCFHDSLLWSDKGGSSGFSEVVAGGQHHDIQLHRAGRVWQVSPSNILVATNHALSFTCQF